MYAWLDVVSMTLAQTTFRIRDGRVLTIANHLLYGMDMVNIRRSGPMADALFLLGKMHERPDGTPAC